MFDFWNMKKVRNLQKELEVKTEQYNRLKADFDKKNLDLETYKKMLNGDRVCGNHCETCAHSIKTERFATVYLGFGTQRNESYTEYACDLNHPCKSYERR